MPTFTLQFVECHHIQIYKININHVNFLARDGVMRSVWCRNFVPTCFHLFCKDRLSLLQRKQYPLVLIGEKYLVGFVRESEISSIALKVKRMQLPKSPSNAISIGTINQMVFFKINKKIELHFSEICIFPWTTFTIQKRKWLWWRKCWPNFLEKFLASIFLDNDRWPHGSL